VKRNGAIAICVHTFTEHNEGSVGHKPFKSCLLMIMTSISGTIPAVPVNFDVLVMSAKSAASESVIIHFAQMWQTLRYMHAFCTENAQLSAFGHHANFLFTGF